jgi:hypothetical protein
MSEDIDTGAAAAPVEAAVIDTAPPAVGADPAPSIDDTLESAWDKAQTGNERGERGQFKSDKPAEPEKPVSADQPPIVAPEPAKPAIDAPLSWSAEARAHWAKLPPEAQAYIAQREGESHKAITSYGEKVKAYEPIEGVLAQHRADIQRRGLTEAQAIATLLEAQRKFDADPLGAATEILRGYGYDLASLLNGNQQAVQRPDPRVQQLEQRLAQFERMTAEQQKAAEEAAFAETQKLVSDFSKDKPYFDEVRPLMAGLMQSGQAKDLAEAYDMAIHASPKVRERIQADQRAKDEAKRKEEAEKAEAEAKRKAEDARKSGKVNVRSGTAHPTPKAMDDTINEIARRAYG